MPLRQLRCWHPRLPSLRLDQQHQVGQSLGQQHLDQQHLVRHSQDRRSEALRLCGQGQ